MAHFEIKDLSFCYPNSEKKALDNINLTIKKGEYITICGRSGSGKTTLLRHLKKPITPSGKRTGEILFHGCSIEEMDVRTQAAAIGYVMQNPDNQIVTDKVWHELAFGLESLGCDTNTIRLKVAEMASYFGIQDWFHKNVNELSGGQKQLLNLASIMAMQPQVLICDEPTSQLDPIAASDFLQTIKKINLELGTTVIMTEHRLEEVFPASDRVVVMEDGKIIADGEPKAVGEVLKKQNNKMFAALPAPMQIYYGVGSKKECPLTVREGRNWLDTELSDKEIKKDRLAERDLPDLYDMPAIFAKELWFRYGKEAKDVLRGTSISVPKGSFYAIVGGNGTGKSTFLKAICGICKTYSGKVKIDGKNINKYKKEELFRGHLALLPQDPQSLFVKKTVKEELLEMAEGADKEAAVARMAEKCELTALLDSHPYDISGGEQQRTALAKVLLTKPDILLMDEPTKGMDNFFKQDFAKIIKELGNITILMVSHDIEFCAKYADIVSLFFDGGIITTNTARKFFAGNSFYTTSANRMSRHLFANAVTEEDVIELCRENL
ncbi:MAG: energy-coupling factor transporter ATPase [Clostridium sp.]|nr:energy-coupling factor transporter ATPase [Clostridium sp.]MCM1399023.1 energy-coupling factor transporter ATPase [Clostridium sp.]MCM1458882.1 energy-coupling factor transporter ATPase [Bacteroides sp.]